MNDYKNEQTLKEGLRGWLFVGMVLIGAAAVLIIWATFAVKANAEKSTGEKFKKVTGYNMAALDTAVIGDMVQLSDGSMRIVFSPPYDGKIVLLAPDLQRDTQKVSVVKSNARGFMPLSMAPETQCLFFIRQLA